MRGSTVERRSDRGVEMADYLRTSDRVGTFRKQLRGRRGAPRRFVVGALAAALACAAGPAAAIGNSVGSLDIVGRADGGVLATYAGGGRHWVVGTPGQEYALRVCNTTGGRLLAVMSVDGVNVISGDTAAPAQSGYVLEPRQCADIEGWRKSLSHTAAFYFTELPDSYAARTGRPANVGVIGVAFFREKPQRISWGAPVGKIAASRSDESAARQESASGANAADAGTGVETVRERMAAREEAPRSAPAVPIPLAKLGTGHGRSETSPTQVTQFEREGAHPNATIAIHYDRRENLIAMGILPVPKFAGTPNPFPGWPPRFTPDPPTR
jgi:hypothetical protein